MTATPSRSGSSASCWLASRCQSAWPSRTVSLTRRRPRQPQPNPLPSRLQSCHLRQAPAVGRPLPLRLRQYPERLPRQCLPLPRYPRQRRQPLPLLRRLRQHQPPRQRQHRPRLRSPASAEASSAASTEPPVLAPMGGPTSAVTTMAGGGNQPRSSRMGHGPAVGLAFRS